MSGLRCAVYGAGAMGTTLGAYIVKNGGKADLFSRNYEHVSAIRKSGAHISGDGVDFCVPVNIYLPDEMRGEYDIIILLTKQTDNKDALPFLKNYLKPDGVICTAQNGLPEDDVAFVVGKERTMGCVVSWGAEMAAPGEVHLTSNPNPKKLRFAIGSPYGKNPKEKDLKELLSLMGKVDTPKNFSGTRWAKLIINCAYSSVSALSGLTFGEVATSKKYRYVIQYILKECFSVAYKAGVKVGSLQGANIKRLLDFSCEVERRLAYYLIPVAMKNHANIVSGMYYDLKKGRHCEIEYMNGKIIETAEMCDVEVLLNRRVVELIKEIEKGSRKLGVENLDDLYHDVTGE